MTEARKYLFFLVVLHAVFFVLALATGNSILPDSIDYLWQAENIKAKGSFYSFDPELGLKIDYYSKRPPLYGLVVLVFKTLSGGIWGLLLLQNILSILTWWWVYRIVKEHFNLKNAAIWVGALCLVFPNQLLYANMVMSESLLMFLLVGAFYSLLKYLQTKRFNWIVLNNVLLALALLTKPIILFFWIVNAVILLILAIKYRTYYLPMPVFLLPMIAILWSEKNYNDTGYRHYSSITHVNLKDYNTKYFLFYKYGDQYGDSVIATIDNKIKTISDYKTQCEYIKDTCKKILLSDVVTYGKFHARGMVNFIADPGRYDYVNFFHITQTDPLGLMHYISKGNWQELKTYIKTQPVWLIVLLLLIMVANGIVFLLCIVYLFNFKTPLWPKIYLIVIVGYIWFFTGPIGAARFKVPVYPLMVIAAAVGGQTLLSKIKRGKVID